MPENKYIPVNFYFLIPYVLWIITGGILFFSFDKQVLFAVINTHHTPLLDTFMYYATWMGEGVTITCVLLLLLVIPALRNWWYFLAAVLCNVLPTLVTQWVKHAVNAPRPLNYFNKAAWIHISPEWPVYMDQSFPSGHTTGSFSMFCFLSLLLPVRYRKLGILFFALALLTGCSRMYLAAHFFADVYAGSIIGGIVALLFYIVVSRYSNNNIVQEPRKLPIS